MKKKKKNKYMLYKILIVNTRKQKKNLRFWIVDLKQF